MAEQPSCKRRVVIRAMIAMAVAVAFLVSYVSSWMLLPIVAVGGHIDWQTESTLEATMYAPVEVYCYSELPGGLQLRDSRNRMKWQAFKAKHPHYFHVQVHDFSK